MQPEEMLDHLLTERARRGLVTSQRREMSSDPTLAPLLATAARLDPLRDATPPAQFAAELERRMLARVGQPTRQPTRQPTTQSAPRMKIIRPASRTAPTNGSRGWRGSPRIPARVAWAAVAAALALTIGLGVFTAQAAPGGPLYSVQQFAQHVASQAFPSPTETAQAALARAKADLASYNADVTRGDPASALVALGALRVDDAQAAQDAAAVQDASARQTMQQRVAQFRQGAAATLRASLAIFDWQGRAQVTDALRAWGASSLQVAQAHVLSDTSTTQDPHANTSEVIVVVSGAGFTPGAALLVNGDPVGVILTLSPMQIKARVAASALVGPTLVVGVQTSDGAVALTTNVVRDDHGAPDHAPTPGSNGNHSNEGASTATPTPRGSGQG